MNEIIEQVAATVIKWRRVWSEDECTRGLEGHESYSAAISRLYGGMNRTDSIVWVERGDNCIDVRRLPSGKLIAIWVICDGDEIREEE